MKKIMSIVLAGALIFGLAGCGGDDSEKEQLKSQVEALNAQIEEQKKQSEYKTIADAVAKKIQNIGMVTLDSEDEIKSCRRAYDSLSGPAKKLITNVDVLVEAEATLQTLIDLQNDTSFEEIKALQADDYKASCQEYSYNDLARNPEQYIDVNAKLRGEVIQVIEESGITILRVNVTQREYSWADTVYVVYVPSKNEPRILENDIITMYGKMDELMTYETIAGGTATIPCMYAQYIDMG